MYECLTFQESIQRIEQAIREGKRDSVISDKTAPCLHTHLVCVLVGMNTFTKELRCTVDGSLNEIIRSLLQSDG